jgi:hypothetical protein
VTTARRKGAPRPKPRTIEAGIAEGDFAGWKATVRIDFPAKLLGEFQSGNVDRILAAATLIVSDWNFPDSDGNVAETLADVDPFVGIVVVVNQAMGAIASLPPR